MNLMLAEIRKTPFFHSLSDTAIKKISLAARTSNYQAGEIIQNESDENSPIFFIIEGLVRVYQSNNAGREQTLLYLHAGDVFNLPTAFTLSGLASASVAAINAVSLLRIPRSEYHKLVLELPELALATITDLSLKVEHLSGLVDDLSLKNVRARLAKFLVQQHEKQDQTIRWTHSAIAARLGTTREIISRLVKAFEVQGAISIERQRILVKDPEALRSEI